MIKDKNVLVIANNFPPDNEGNVLRVVKFVKKIPQFGWKPYVLTVNESSIVRKDNSHQDVLQQQDLIYRVFYPNLFLFLDKRWQKKENKKGDKVSLPTDTRYAHKTHFSVATLIKKVIFEIIKEVRKEFLIPEEVIMWFPFAVSKGYFLCRKKEIKVIFSSAPHFTNHLVGLALKITTGARWIADFRDLWTNNPYYWKKYSWRRKIDTALDRLILNKADRITVVSESWRRCLLQNYSFLKPEKVICITNGYDLEDFVGNDVPDGKYFDITHMGTIFPGYPTGELIKILHRLSVRIPFFKDKVRLNLYGDIYPSEAEKISRSLRECQMNNTVHLHSRIPREEAAYVIKKSALLLLMYIKEGKNIEGCIPSKTFDYLASQRPILAIVPEVGDAAEIIRQSRTGDVLSIDKKEEIEKTIEEFYYKWTRNKLCISPDLNIVNSYNRDALTKRLVQMFDSLANSDNKTCEVRVSYA